LSVQEVIGVIRIKFGEQGLGPDNGLFLPSQRLWLSPAKLLDFYDLQNGEILEYKKKNRPLRIQTLDGTTKTVIVDETLPVVNLVSSVCEKFGSIECAFMIRY
jgi:talin